MKQTKLEKGITLIALVITIIVLLILAVVAIASVQESDIIKKAQDATKTYKEKEEEEKQGLQEYVDFIKDKTTTKQINHDTIIKIGEDILNNRITEAEALQRLKDEGAIEQDAVTLKDSISYEQLWNGGYAGGYAIYFEKINALYKISETDSGIILSYLDDPLENQIVKCVRITRETLNDIFLGENEVPADLIPNKIDDILEPENEKKFLDYIVNNSNRRIKSIGKIDHISSYSGRIYLSDLLIVDENGHEIILEFVDKNGDIIPLLFGYNSGCTVALKPENGIITSIDVHIGT